MSMYPRETINELNALSKTVFGSSSKWRKMVEKGVRELVQEDSKRLTIKDGKEATETVKTTVLYKDHIPLNTLNRYTVESVRKFMLTVLDRRAQMQEAIKRLDEQKKAEDAAKEAARQASGTAV